MSTNVTTAMLAELRGLKRVYPVLELTLAGTKHRFSQENTPVGSASQGLYRPYVSNFGDITRAIGDTSFALQSPTTSVTIIDAERTLQKTLGGPAAGGVKGAKAQIYARSPVLEVADHWLVFDGIVDGFRPAGAGSWDFELKPDDRELNASTLSPLTDNTITSLPTDEVGSSILDRVIYGSHKSTGILGATGMIPLIPITDEAVGGDSVWLMGINALQTAQPQALYKNGVVESLADWNGDSLFFNGANHAVISNTAVSKATPSDKITVDINGVLTLGTTGDLIDNPADVLKHFLVNFVFNKWPTAQFATTWFADSTAPVSVSHFTAAAAYFSQRGIKCAKMFTSNDTGLAVLNAMCAAFQMHPFWTADWKIAVAVDDPTELDQAPDEAHITADHSADAQGLPLPMSGEVIESEVNRINIDYLLNEASGATTRSNSVQDTRRATTVSKSVKFLHGSSSAVD